MDHTAGEAIYNILTRGDLIDEHESSSASSSFERLREESDCNISCVNNCKSHCQEVKSKKPLTI